MEVACKFPDIVCAPFKAIILIILFWITGEMYLSVFCSSHSLICLSSPLDRSNSCIKFGSHSLPSPRSGSACLAKNRMLDIICSNICCRFNFSYLCSLDNISPASLTVDGNVTIFSMNSL